MDENKYLPEEEVEGVGDELIENLRKILKAEESGSYMLNIERCREMTAAYNTLKNIAQKSGGKTSIKFNEPFPSMVSMTVCGKSVEFLDSDGFLSVAESADNLDAYPLTNGNINITFTFHGLTYRIKGV